MKKVGPLKSDKAGVKCWPKETDVSYISIPALSFCSEYSAYGCCTSEEDSALEQRFTTVSHRFYYSLGNCGEHLKTALCLRCNPYAAHLFEAEGRSRHYAFPGFCNTTCHQFIQDCRLRGTNGETRHQRRTKKEWIKKTQGEKWTERRKRQLD